MSGATRQSRPSRAARFTQADIGRAIKGAVAAGMRVAEAMVTRDGDIRLIFSIPGDVAQSGRNDWD
jgi:hypothetical protein